MNLLSLMRYKYEVDAGISHEHNKAYCVLECKAIKDKDGYGITKLELETLRDNAKSLYEACNNALPEYEQT